jgi:hypothetical protein
MVPGTMERMAQKAREVEHSFDRFHSLQTTVAVDSAMMAEVKTQLRGHLLELDAELGGRTSNQTFGDLWAVRRYHSRCFRVYRRVFTLTAAVI